MTNLRLAGVSIFISAIVVAVASTPTFMAVPDRVRQKVYGLELWNGTTYQTTFCPKDISEMYMLAESDNVVTPLVTDVYYWPITQEYIASWFDYRKELEGVLEVWGNGKKVTTLTPTEYAFLYPQGPYATKAVLILGAAAKEKYKGYQLRLDDYYDELSKFHSEWTRYEEQVAKFYANAGRFASSPDVPKEPVPPQEYVTQPAKGFVVNLPAGVYDLRFVEHTRMKGSNEATGEADSAGGETGDGLKPGGRSEDDRDDTECTAADELEPQGTLSKRLIVFDYRRRGIGYEIIPEEKWTMPLRSDEPRDGLYTGGQRPLFLKAFDAAEYNAMCYARLCKLQQPFAGRGLDRAYTWVHLTEKDGVKLQILEHGNVVGTISKQSYLVEQTPGATLGYEIVEYTEKERNLGKQPSFEAFKVAIDAKRDMQIRLVDEDGGVVQGSERTIKTVNKSQSKRVFLIIALPLLLRTGLSIFSARNIRKSG
ncbi:MAG: hypothetical protein AB1700_00440 [Bacillota bacterium]